VPSRRIIAEMTFWIIILKTAFCSGTMLRFPCKKVLFEDIFAKSNDISFAGAHMGAPLQVLT
jgi:hypothetical protein